jgi:hypothetical protein
MSVYGKKIMVDGIRYVAIPEKHRGSCKGCSFFGKHCPYIDDFLECAFHGIIFKKDTKQPKKKSKPQKVNKTTFKDLDLRIWNILSDTNKFVADSPLKDSFSVAHNNQSQYIVCLTENGKLFPSEQPKIHKTEVSAMLEAGRLCRKHNKEFVVMRAFQKLVPVVQAFNVKV